MTNPEPPGTAEARAVVVTAEMRDQWRRVCERQLQTDMKLFGDQHIARIVLALIADVETQAAQAVVFRVAIFRALIHAETVEPESDEQVLAAAKEIEDKLTLAEGQAEGLTRALDQLNNAGILDARPTDSRTCQQARFNARAALRTYRETKHG